MYAIFHFFLGIFFIYTSNAIPKVPQTLPHTPLFSTPPHHTSEEASGCPHPQFEAMPEKTPVALASSF